MQAYRDTRSYFDIRDQFRPMMQQFQTIKNTESNRDLIKPMVYQISNLQSLESTLTKQEKSLDVEEFNDPFKDLRVKSQLNQYQTMQDYEKAEAMRIKLDEIIPTIYKRKSKNMFLGVHPRNTLEQYDNDQEWSKLANP